MRNRMIKVLILGMAITLSLLTLTSAQQVHQPVAGTQTNHTSRTTHQQKTVTQTRQTQQAMTPQKALEMLKHGNERFVHGRMLKRDLRAQVKATAEGQYPFASILSCIDSRASSELIFDQGLGDIFNARVAGNIVNEDILGSLEFATKVAGSKLIVVLGHTSCGAVKGAIDDVKLGNLTTLLEKIKPAIDDADHHQASRTSKNHELVEEVSEINVKRMIQEIKEKSPLLKEMIDKGEIRLVGGMHDLKTGKVTFYQN